MQIAGIQYDKEKKKIQPKISKICDKRRDQLKSAPDYYVAGNLIDDTTVFLELFHINEDSDENFDSCYDSDDSSDSYR